MHVMTIIRPCQSDRIISKLSTCAENCHPTTGCAGGVAYRLEHETWHLVYSERSQKRQVGGKEKKIQEEYDSGVETFDDTDDNQSNDATSKGYCYSCNKASEHEHVHGSEGHRVKIIASSRTYPRADRTAEEECYH